MKWGAAELKKEQPPPGMTNSDRLCNDCKERLPKRSKNADGTKSLNTSKVIQYKDSNVCILTHMVGSQKEFYAEFSNITAQGYELKSTYAPSSSFIGIGGSPMAICYFQKSMNVVISSETSKETQQESHGTTMVKFCKNCGNSNGSSDNLCKYCGKVL